MRIGMFLSYAGGFAETVTELADYERAGADIVFVPEAYSFDAVSQLGFIAAKTERMQIASGILPLYSRTPALLAMTAAGLDFVSGGPVLVGLGAARPAVMRGARDHGDLREGLAPRPAGLPGQVLPPAAGGGSRPGQAAQAHQPSGP